MNCGLRLADCGFKRGWKIILLSTVYCLLSASPAFAHKVNIFAYVEGDMVYTESYFPDGKKVEGGRVEVYDSQGKKLLEGRTDREGQFNFKPPQKDNLKIVLVASMGHRNSYILSGDELPDKMPSKQKELPAQAKSRPSLAGYRKHKSEDEMPPPSQVDLDKIKQIIDTSLDEKLKPIVKELRRQKETASFREIIAGVGYIFGIFGIILYFMSRRKKD